MDRGWGLTLDSDSLGFFSPNTATGAPANVASAAPHRPPSGFLKLLSQHNHSRAAAADVAPFMVSTSSAHTGHRRSDLMSAAVSPPSSPRENRAAVIGEVDFFLADSKNRSSPPAAHEASAVAVAARVVKKESEANLDVNTGLRLLTANTGSDESTVDDGISADVEDKRAKNELAQLQVELQRMNAENQRLREMLGQVTNNYSAMQMHLTTLIHQQQSHGVQSTREHEVQEGKSIEKIHDQELVPRQFLDLVPSGMTADNEEVSHSSSDERTRDGSGSPGHNIELATSSGHRGVDQDGKTKRLESPDSEIQGWVPNKAPKLDGPKAIDQSSAEATMRKARVSVRARSEAPMITDGCQWRKYGQKMAKGNPCPRAYYRCTMAVGCPVRKQVQRCAEDRSILITTYEGNHNHLLPPAAMAMASTTTSAVSMLLSGSMSSADGSMMNPNLLARAILPCSSSMATISASAPFPTVTLDLTHSPNPNLPLQRPQAHQFQVPVVPSHQNPPNFPTNLHSQTLPQVFGHPLYNQSKFSGLQLSQDTAPNVHPGHQQQPSLADTVNAATAAITADPNFTAALAAAISSIIGSGGGSHPNSGSNSNNGNITPSNSNSNNSNKMNGFLGN